MIVPPPPEPDPPPPEPPEPPEPEPPEPPEPEPPELGGVVAGGLAGVEVTGGGDEAVEVCDWVGLMTGLGLTGCGRRAGTVETAGGAATTGAEDGVR
jgi:hypothetical protein